LWAVFFGQVEMRTTIPDSASELDVPEHEPCPDAARKLSVTLVGKIESCP